MIPLLAPVLALISAPSPRENVTFESAVAAKAERTPFSCGILMSYGLIDFTHRGETIRVYYLCAEEEDLPRQGARCTVTFHEGTITQMTPDRRETPFTGNILDKMTCDPPAEAAHHDYRGATVIGYGPLPKKDGGTGTHPRPVQVRTAKGEQVELYFVHGYWDDKGVPMTFVDTQWRHYPAIGSKCDFSTSASMRYRGGVRDPAPAELIYQIRC